MNPVPANRTEPVPSPSERLSAWLDGETTPGESAPLLDQLLSQPGLRARTREWVLCGDALRSHETAADLAPGHDERVLARVAAALRDEPALLAPAALRAPRPERHLRRNAAMFAGVAAAVAVLTLVVLPQVRMAGGGPDAGGVVAFNGTGADAQRIDGATPVSAQADPALDPYFLAHGSYASGGVMPAAAVYLRHGPIDEK